MNTLSMQLLYPEPSLSLGSIQLTGVRAWLPLSPCLMELCATDGDCEVNRRCCRPVLRKWSGASSCPPSGAPLSHHIPQSCYFYIFLCTVLSLPHLSVYLTYRSHSPLTNFYNVLTYSVVVVYTYLTQVLIMPPQYLQLTLRTTY